MHLIFVMKLKKNIINIDESNENRKNALKITNNSSCIVKWTPKRVTRYFSVMCCYFQVPAYSQMSLIRDRTTRRLQGEVSRLVIGN